MSGINEQGQMSRIDLPSVRERFFYQMKEADDKVTYNTHTRRLKQPDGSIRVVEYSMKPQTLQRTKVERVFTSLLTKYVHHYNRLYAIMPPGTYSKSDYPALKTTNPQVGFSAGCSDRTARSMIRNLQDMGVLTKTFKGSRGGIEIQFSAGILWGETDQEKALILPQNIVPEGSYLNIFPHKESDRKSNEKENINKAENVDKDRRNYGEMGSQIAPVAPREPLESPQTNEVTEIKLGGGGEDLSTPSVDMTQNRHSKAEKDAFRKAKASENERLRLVAIEAQKAQYGEWQNKCKQAVMYFWAVAYEKLFTGRNYDAQDVQKILSTIWTDVFFNFQYVRNAKELADSMTRNLAKIEKAAIYYDRNPGAYLPDPHSIMVEGKGYFDKKNLRGFAGLEAWMKKDECEKGHKRLDFLAPRAFKARKIERLLTTSRRDFEKQAAGAKARVEVAHLDMVGLMQYYTLIFRNLGDDALKRFNEQILTQQRHNFRAKSRPRSHKAPEIVEVEAWMSSFGESYYSQ